MVVRGDADVFLGDTRGGEEPLRGEAEGEDGLCDMCRAGIPKGLAPRLLVPEGEAGGESSKTSGEC